MADTLHIRVSVGRDIQAFLVEDMGTAFFALPFEAQAVQMAHNLAVDRFAAVAVPSFGLDRLHGLSYPEVQTLAEVQIHVVAA